MTRNQFSPKLKLIYVEYKKIIPKNQIPYEFLKIKILRFCFWKIAKTFSIDYIKLKSML